MTSHPPAQCCTVGIKHEGTPQGEIKTIGNIRSYVSYPANKNTENAIIIFTDIYGIDLDNIKLIADQLAANGYFVVIPDLFRGDPVPFPRPDPFDIQAWLKKHQPNDVDPIAEATIKELRGSFGAKRVGSVGYCFGAKYTCRFLKEGQADVGYVAHPSFVTAEELQGIQGPLSIAAAETDTIFPTEKRHESEEILRKNSLPFQIFLYSGVEHGFTTRGDLSKKPIKFAKEQAFFQAVNWFEEFLKG